jgi:hypothetical protein
MHGATLKIILSLFITLEISKHFLEESLVFKFDKTKKNFFLKSIDRSAFKRFGQQEFQIELPLKMYSLVFVSN